jgi:hypothetical protein
MRIISGGESTDLYKVIARNDIYTFYLDILGTIGVKEFSSFISSYPYNDTYKIFIEKLSEVCHAT